MGRGGGMFGETLDIGIGPSSSSALPPEIGWLNNQHLIWSFGDCIYGKWQNSKVTWFWTSFPFPFLIIPGNNNVSFPFPKVGIGICPSRSRSQKLGMEFVIPVPIPKSWECYFSFPFPFPKFGNGLSNFRSQSPKVIPALPWHSHKSGFMTQS